MADAFRMELPTAIRKHAREKFDRAAADARAAANRTLFDGDRLPHPTDTEVQLAPCYVQSWPLEIAVQSAIGLTCFLDARRYTQYLPEACRNSDKLLESLVDKAADENVPVEGLLNLCAKAVEGRMLSELIRRHADLDVPIESYRLFLAAQQSMQFSSIAEIIDAAVLFSDVLPQGQQLRMHPISRKLFRLLSDASETYLEALPGLRSEILLYKGIQWAFDLALILVKHVSRQQRDENRRNRNVQRKQIEPLAALRPPRMLNRPSNPGWRLQEQLIPQEDEDETDDGDSGNNEKKQSNADDSRDEAAARAARALQDLSTTIQQTLPPREAVDSSHTELAAQLRDHAFEEGPTEFELERMEIRLRQSHLDFTVGGIIETVVKADCDNEILERLRYDANPLANAIDGLFFHGKVNPEVHIEHRHTRGAIDPARLAVISFSETVYRRMYPVRKEGKDHSALLAIAADVSSSLSRRQLAMVKLLCSGFLLSKAHRMEMLMAMYTGIQTTRRRQLEALVDWIIHPVKTAKRSPEEAMHALAGYSSSRGQQLDALTLKHLIDTCMDCRVDPEQTLYYCWITDAVWKPSGMMQGTPHQEVKAVLSGLKHMYGQSLHLTLIILGDNEHGLADLPDAVVRVKNEELSDVGATAQRLADYVAGMVIKQGRSVT
ncbi:hypothetical protein KQI65_00505 [bacterium]|nr:hypothetical protein [bacterium]